MCLRLTLNTILIFVFVWNIVVLVCGLTTLVLGTKLISSDVEGDLMKQLVNVAGGIILSVGIIISLIGFLGCFGSFSKSVGMMKAYVAIVIAMVTLQAAALLGVRAAWLELSNQVPTFIKTSAESKQKQVQIQAVLAQKFFQCCGGFSAEEWKGKENIFCCKEKTPCVSLNDRYNETCETIIKRSVPVKKFTGFAILFLLVQMCPVIVACILIFPMKHLYD